jgi:AcrR family transcriptional regulator
MSEGSATVTEPSVRTPGKRARGRPRVLDDNRILSITLEMLAELGYERMSLAEVADRTGVSKPSLYRRWENKAELVSAAIEHSHRTRPLPSGDVRLDLVAEVRDVRRTYAATVDMGMVGALLSEEKRHPEFIEAWRHRIVAPRRAGVEGIVTQAQEAGQLRADVVPAIVSELLLGAFYAAYLAGNPMDDAWDEQVVDIILRGIETG